MAKRSSVWNQILWDCRVWKDLLPRNRFPEIFLRTPKTDRMIRLLHRTVPAKTVLEIRSLRQSDSVQTGRRIRSFHRSDAMHAVRRIRPQHRTGPEQAGRKGHSLHQPDPEQAVPGLSADAILTADPSLPHAMQAGYRMSVKAWTDFLHPDHFSLPDSQTEPSDLKAP